MHLEVVTDLTEETFTQTFRLLDSPKVNAKTRYIRQRINVTQKKLRTKNCDKWNSLTFFHWRRQGKDQ